MANRSSFSQHNIYHGCKRQWYYAYVKKHKVWSDMCYAHAGSVIHKILEIYYTDKTINVEEVLRKLFDELWDKYNLPKSMIKEKKELYWDMVLNGIALNKNFAHQELKIAFDDIVAYIDAVGEDGMIELEDWKSSTRSKKNEEEYKLQLKVYAWLYHRKFGVIPDKCTVQYLKYKDEKKRSLSILPTMDDIKNTEKWYYDILTDMTKIKTTDKIPTRCFDEGVACNFFCPYKEMCFSTDKTLKYTLHNKGNHLYLEGPVAPLLQKGLEENFSYRLQNAHFICKARPGYDGMVRFWNTTKQILPSGFEKILRKTLKDYCDYKQLNLEIKYKDYRTPYNPEIKMPDKFLNGMVLRGYQQEVVDKFMKEKIGIMCCPTGSGKTIILIECIRKLACKTLFVVERVELLRQTKKKIKECLGIEVGQVGGGEVDWKPVTVATIQTLAKKIEEFSPMLNKIQFLIGDEIHHSASASYKKVFNKCNNSLFRAGASATPEREDGNTMVITSGIGGIFYNISIQTLIEDGHLVRPNIYFYEKWMTNKQVSDLENQAVINFEKRRLYKQHEESGLNYDKGDMDDIELLQSYRYFYDMLVVNNQIRNDIVCCVAMENKERKVLILTKSIPHGVALHQNLEGSKHIYGGTNKKEREQIMKDFSGDKCQILVSSIGIFSEGIDIPSIGAVINASANKSDTKTIQLLGRVLRTMEGKDDALYIDFIDFGKFTRTASLKRMKALRSEGHYVKKKQIES